ncbi:MAG: hypothetical protein LBQ31_10875 [Bacteroidales bacterium]|jgi:hypothetical protein|nr:hypothetical protein [Bacteroidales bacterium]
MIVTPTELEKNLNFLLPYFDLAEKGEEIVLQTSSNKNFKIIFTPTKKLKTMSSHFGALKRGIDGLEYQKQLRDEWD